MFRVVKSTVTWARSVFNFFGKLEAFQVYGAPSPLTVKFKCSKDEGRCPKNRELSILFSVRDVKF